jgi:ABC-type sugar transport system permease subunit
MLASFSIPMMIGQGEGPQMVMIDVYYRIVQHNDYGVANALGVVSYLTASGAAIYYLTSVTKKG